MAMTDTACSVYEYMRAYRAKGGGVALVRGSAAMTFRKFFKAIDRVAGGLSRMGIRKGDVVMLALPAIEQSVVAFYALSRLGAIASMIHPKLAPGEFGRAVAEQKPKAVFLSDVNLFKYASELKGVRKVYCPFGLNAYVGLPRSGKFAPYTGDGSEPALYMRSGGTSGRPKTVVLSSAATNALVANLLTSLEDKFGENDAMLAALPLFHGFGLVVGVHASLCTNMRSVLLPIFSGEKAVAAIKRNRVTTMIAVPRMIKKLLTTPSFNGEAVRSLENVYVGGDAVDIELKRAFDLRMRSGGSAATLSPGYGLTETGSVCVLCRGGYPAGSVGRPLAGVEAFIAREDGGEAADGETGELWLGAEQMMEGYLDDPAGTAEAFAVTAQGRRMLKTGDLFKRDPEGNLFFMGRLKRLIKISGMNVFPSEIERVAKTLPFISECAAIETAVGGKTFVRLIVEGELCDERLRALRKKIGDELSHWHVPEYVECVEELPRTSIGKIDFKRLSDEYK